MDLAKAISSDTTQYGQEVTCKSRLTILRAAKASLWAVALLSSVGCGSLAFKDSKILPSGSQTANSNTSNRRWLKEGSILVARPLPEAEQISMQTLLGFLPHKELESRGKWLALDRNSETIKIMNGAKELSSISAPGLSALKPGTYKIAHKQRNALWHAPDEYFTARNLSVPPKGDRERFRRGALGDFVLFLDKDTPIHSGPIAAKEIGGIQVTEKELSRIYYLLEVGSVVQVG